MNGMPKHIAIIMDGNGRWGKRNRLTRSEGHYAGAQAMEKVIDASMESNIEALTLYAFSSENWSRTKEEVNYLMRLPVRFLKQKLPGFMKRNIKIVVSGDTEVLPTPTRKALMKAIEETKDNDGLIVNFAFNYGGRAEIIRAAKKMMEKVQKEGVEIDEQLFQSFLYTRDLPELDLIIRTGGEKRLSNFLLWQSANAEMYFTDVYFPNFTGDHLREILYDYRDKRAVYDFKDVFRTAR